MRKEVKDVIEIRLTCRGINDGLKRDTEKGKGKKEKEEKEDRAEHTSSISLPPLSTTPSRDIDFAIAVCHHIG